MANAYNCMFELKDDIYAALKLDKNTDIKNVLFDASCLEFAHFVNNIKALQMEIKPEYIFGFMTSIIFHKMSVVSCSPKLLNQVCETLSINLKQP